MKKEAEDEKLMSETAGRYRRSYSKSELFFGNAAIILWIGLGALACGLFFPFSAFVFFGVAAFLIFYEIGKHGCVTCYYCKTCTIGIGKLPELFFKHAQTANANQRALKLFPFAYTLLSVLPIILISISIFQEIVMYKVVLLAGVLMFSVYTGITKRHTIVNRSSKIAD